MRKALNYPPYSRITIIETKSEDAKLTEAKIKEIFNLIKQLDNENNLELLPPNPPLLSKLKDKYRYHLLIKSNKETKIPRSYPHALLRSGQDGQYCFVHH